MSYLVLLGTLFFYLVLVVAFVLIPLGFPGTWLMLTAAIIYALVGDLNPAGSDWIPLIIVALMAGLGEMIELGIRILGSRVAAVPTGAIIAAIAGGLIGALIGVPVFLIGSLIGLLLGIFLGAFAYGWVATHEISRSLWMAVATTCSQVIALFAKSCIGIAIIVYLTVILF